MALQLLNETARFEVCDADLPNVEPLRIANPDPEVFYTIRSLLPYEVRRISQQFTTPARRNGQQETVDMPAVLDALVDAAVVGWRGVVDGDTEVPCTTENKARLDIPRKTALMTLAGSNRSSERRAESFRPPT